MDQMNSDMMTAAMAEDIDVAFVCGMIPHHQGTIAMAKAELLYGDNEMGQGDGARSSTRRSRKPLRC
ncbi:DUF305 domain-containing protein [Devosia limi]|uniref:DUF305 domain-containing protein n=1 Tax=Devosia limi DSM 17137 TaxID=1121477 RepID=A0A1M5CT33_9HYPH|nr:DUF305 domain-containing protein [Devosia limi]SHF57909.1 protein of unknown function [Devosia limi DSM 17137]